MTISGGSRLGPYEMLVPLGAGGMGEVWKAKDTRLGRTVAIKILPERFAEDAVMRQRFEREARTISQLSHPHICALHDVGREGQTEYLVMEFLEGETLAERLAKGPLALELVLRWGMEIADALDNAHRQGIAHRDLKPGNVMLTKTGVKLLDFGLSKIFERPLDAAGREQAAAAQHPLAKRSLTALSTEIGGPNLTQEGSLLGTLPYMAPEQLEGKEADARSDIFAFGAVLYEMATGLRAFAATSQASLIAAIIHNEPAPIAKMRPVAPAALDRIVRQCLAKDPDERWQSAHDIRSQLQWVEKEASFPQAESVGAFRARRSRLWWLLGGALAGALLAAAGIRSLFPGSPPLALVSRIALTVSPSDEVSLLDPPAISPDGRSIVYVAQRGKGSGQLFLHRLDAREAAPLAGTEGASCPFFSPDGRWVGFTAAGSIRKIPVGGGAPVVICSKAALVGASWGPQDLIVFSSELRTAEGLMRVSASGGEPQPLTKLTTKPEDLGHFWPEILPDGKAAVFTVFTGKKGPEENDIAVVQLATGDKKILIRGGSYARYVATGHLVFARGGVLLAIAFDPKRLEVKGAPFEVERGVSHSRDGHVGFAVSRDGTLVSVDHIVQARSLLWLDRKGNTNPVTSFKRAYDWPKLSPDGGRVAIGVQEDSGDILVLDLARDSLTRVTFGGEDQGPTWSPDGKRLAYTSARGDRIFKMFVRPSDGSGSDELLPCPPRSIPVSWSPDGKFLAFYSWNHRPLQIWLYPIGTGEPARPLIQNAFNNVMPRISPDGHWMAYMSDETGEEEIYVTSFPDAKGKWQVSQGKGGGHDPLWALTGREIFYRQADKIMAVKVRTTPTFSADRPEFLFEHPYYDEWDVAADGRFVMVTDEKILPTHLNLLLNWSTGLKAPGAAAGKQ